MLKRWTVVGVALVISLLAWGPVGLANHYGDCYVDGTIGTGTYIWECSSVADHLNSGSQRDYVNFKGGNDWGEVDGGGDVVSSGDGADLIWGGAGPDNIDGEHGNDRIVGGDGNDSLSDDAFFDQSDFDRVCDGLGLDDIDLSDGDGRDILYLRPFDGHADTISIDGGDEVYQQNCPFSS